MNQIVVNEQYQTGYEYTRTEKPGENFAADFTPDLTPKEMLQLGIFAGNYFYEVPHEFPADWFDGVELSDKPDKNRNYYKVMASQPLQEWQRKGWIHPEDPKGWFLWYCRYYMGRRIPEEDARQIRRWRNVRRHFSQIQKNCMPHDQHCRPRQRQALLHWAYDMRKF